MNSKLTIPPTVFILLLCSSIVALFSIGCSDRAKSSEEGSENSVEEAEELDEGEVVHMDEAEIKEFGIESSVADSGNLGLQISLPGEIRMNKDRFVHVVPLISGVATEVRKNIGDEVNAGDVLAVISSRELADAKSTYLAALERVSIAQANYTREEGLRKKNITSEQEYLEARQALAETNIELKLNKQKLQAIGLSKEEVAKISEESEEILTRYELTSPFEGTVIEKHLVLGERVSADEAVFVIADLKTVWVDLSVYQKDLPHVAKGQTVLLCAGEGIDDCEGVISYIEPLVGEKTRTSLARVFLPNKDGKWRPGLFITAIIDIGEIRVPVMVEKSAVMMIDDEPHIFITHEEGFEAIPVELGREDDRNVEVTANLEVGQEYVSKGAFTLKSELEKGSFGHGHSH